MTDKELQKLKRSELLEIMLNINLELDKAWQEIENLKQQNEKLLEQLAEKKIRSEESGSIADAAMELSGDFRSAQEAADVYINNIKNINEKKNKEYSEKINAADRQAEKIISEAESRAAIISRTAKNDSIKLMKETADKCNTLIKQTNEKCINKIKEVQQKCDSVISLNDQITEFFKSAL